MRCPAVLLNNQCTIFCEHVAHHFTVLVDIVMFEHQHWGVLPIYGCLLGFLTSGQLVYTAVSRTQLSSPTTQQQKAHRRTLPENGTQ